MKTRIREDRPATAESIARRADAGEDISRFFTNDGRMMKPVESIEVDLNAPRRIRRVNVDFTVPMLDELDQRARVLNISRQAVIKTLLRQALDQSHQRTA